MIDEISEANLLKTIVSAFIMTLFLTKSLSIKHYNTFFNRKMAV